MRILLAIINIMALIVLGFYAKDPLIHDVNAWLSSTKAHNSTISPGGSIEVAFSPRGGATAAIVAALAEAKKTILVSAFSFTSKDIAEALLAAKKRRVDVKLVLDKSQMTQKYSSSTFFINQGFDIRIDAKHAIFHNKFIVIDDKTVITGSFNFTKAAEHKNAENVLIIRNNPVLAKRYSNNWWLHRNESLVPDKVL